MPIYEFQCRKCGKDSEILVRSSKWTGTECPHCGSTRLEKKLSVFASSAAAAGGDSLPPCGVNPGSSGCGACCAGRPHQH